MEIDLNCIAGRIRILLLQSDLSRVVSGAGKWNTTECPTPEPPTPLIRKQQRQMSERCFLVPEATVHIRARQAQPCVSPSIDGLLRLRRKVDPRTVPLHVNRLQ